MSARAGLLARIEASGRHGQLRMSTRPFCSCSTACAPKRTLRLAPAKPMWSYRRSDIAIGSTNARLRKAAMTGEDFAKLEAMRPRMTALIPRRTTLEKELNALSEQVAKQLAALGKGDESVSKSKCDEDRAKVRQLKEETKAVVDELNELNAQNTEIRLKMPNLTNPKVPVGDEGKAVMIGRGGDSSLLKGELRQAFEQTQLPVPLENVAALRHPYSPEKERDHLDMATAMGWIDDVAARVINGPSWPVLVGPLANLEHALVRYAMEEACRAGFVPVVVPDVVKRDLLSRTGFSPREGGGGQVYWVKGDESDKAKPEARESPGDLALAATAEIPLAGLCAGTLYDGAADLPKQYVASSHAFRAEAGARGLESKGLYRVHQFTKVELFVVCRAEESEEWLEKLRAVQERILSGLQVPYRVLDMPTEELGASAYRKYDMEAWMPGRGSWGEVSSASNCTEYQARRLGIRYRLEHPMQVSNEGLGPGNAWAHTLNGTAVAVPRLIVALLENYGVSSEGKIRLPVALKKHWTASIDGEVEWIGEEVPATNPRQGALQRVRQMAAKSGTDPASMVVSFAVLHELTAIVPLVLLFYLLGLLGAGEQVMEWLLQLSGSEESGSGAWLRGKINEGMQRAEKFGRRNGYFGFEAGSEVGAEAGLGARAGASALAGSFANAVAAYAITKAAFPLRIGASIALAGPFARLCIEPLKRLTSRIAVQLKRRRS